MKDEAKGDLGSYLQDHYAGAVGAIDLLGHLSSQHEGGVLEAFFQGLLADVKADHERLHEMMTALDVEESSVRNAGAWVAEKVSRAKIGFGGSEKAGLRLVEALETLFIGITGKMLLWKALQVVQEAVPALRGIDFEHLQKRAHEQSERVDAERLEVVGRSFRSV